MNGCRLLERKRFSIQKETTNILHIIDFGDKFQQTIVIVIRKKLSEKNNDNNPEQTKDTLLKKKG